MGRNENVRPLSLEVEDEEEHSNRRRSVQQGTYNRRVVWMKAVFGLLVILCLMTFFDSIRFFALQSRSQKEEEEGK